MQWNQTYGGPLDARVYSVQQTNDGGYIIAGEMDTIVAGLSDFWLIKLAPEAVSYTLIITTTSGGTTQPAPGTYAYLAGSSVDVNAIPDANYAFDHWLLDGNDIGSANPYSVLMDSDHTLHAVFLMAGDFDGDEIPDSNDNCPYVYNPSQTDSDKDEIGNACDEDCPNLDGLNPVSLFDFSTLAADWQLTEPNLPGDLDKSGVVDVNDLGIFATYWLSGCYE